MLSTSLAQRSPYQPSVNRLKSPFIKSLVERIGRRSPERPKHTVFLYTDSQSRRSDSSLVSMDVLEKRIVHYRREVMDRFVEILVDSLYVRVFNRL